MRFKQKPPDGPSESFCFVFSKFFLKESPLCWHGSYALYLPSPSVCLKAIWFLAPINWHTLINVSILSIDHDGYSKTSKTSGLSAVYRMKSRLLWGAPQHHFFSLLYAMHFKLLVLQNISSLVRDHLAEWSQGTKIHWNYLFIFF